MNHVQKLIKLTWFIPLLLGCSQIGGLIGSSYHNTTAHYNAYFYANERINEIEQSVEDQYIWNYNKILPVFAQFDTTVSQSVSTTVEDCIKKASIAIQRHEGSKWEDDSYVIVGRARFYNSEFADAIETFKYVNKKGKDDDARHEALIGLFRSFIEVNEMNNAIAVSDYLKKEELNHDNTRDLELTRAYFYQKRNDLDKMVQHLVTAQALLKRGMDAARIAFIVGQVYQKLGFDAEAYSYYNEVLHNGPNYELEFYTKLNMAQVTQKAKNEDLKKIRKYFRKLLKDPKNLEYQDKIYFEMAEFELKNGEMDPAIDFYKLSVRKSVKNQRQKAHSYWKLGIIYYDSLKKFPLAKAYYDSTMSIMPQDEEKYELIKQRQEVLEDFVNQLTTIHLNDSLVNLYHLPEDSVLNLAKAKAEKEMLAEKERKKKEKQQARRESMTTSFDQNTGNLINTNTTGHIWYFYNNTAITKGLSEFTKKWGNIPLADNWRRSQKNSDVAIDAKPEQNNNENEVPEVSEDDQLQQLIESYLAQVPKSDEEIATLLSEIETALYRLGSIYNFKLEEKQNAIETFEQLLSRFEDSEYEAEVLYQLYLLYGKFDETLALEKAEKLKAKYPNSIYAKLIDNPNYREDSMAATEQLMKVYNVAYQFYQKGLYGKANNLLDSALYIHPDNDFSDNLHLLKVILLGLEQGKYKYQYELNNFIKTYPESDVVDYAQKLLTASETYQKEVNSAGKAKFIKYFDQEHFVVITYPNKDELSSAIPPLVDELLAENEKLQVGNLILSEETALVLISSFTEKASALQFVPKLESLDLKNNFKGERIYQFAISKDNFDIFYQTKDLDAYLNFYERTYQ